MADRERLYNDLHKAFKSANHKLNHSQCDIQASKIWRQFQTKENFLEVVQEEIRKCRLIASKKKLTLDSNWVSQNQRFC